MYTRLYRSAGRVRTRPDAHLTTDTSSKGGDRPVTAPAVKSNPAPTPAVKRQISRPEEVWVEVKKYREQPKRAEDLKSPRRGWKTVRVFVSSTFRDFFDEREVLVKQVFPELQIWCEERKVHIVECDLRWGVPEHTSDAKTLEMCLEEIDRCQAENVAPYFINLTSERTGWIPGEEKVDNQLMHKYKLVYGLSVTEMEIVHAAYRQDNPNSIFLIRDDSFLKTLPKDRADLREQFEEEVPDDARKKLACLKDIVRQNFPAERVIDYNCRFKKLTSPTAGEKEKVVFEYDEHTWTKVLDFLKGRIMDQYPLLDAPLSEQELQHDQHTAFMETRGTGVLGRDSTAQQIKQYLDGDERVAMVIVAEAGMGKSAVMAKVVKDLRHNINAAGGDEVLFYHFVGAVPRSTDVITMLRRLLTAVTRQSSEASTEEEVVQQSVSLLSKDHGDDSRVTVIIDAVNQFDEDDSPVTTHTTWLPKRLGHNVRVVLSTIEGSRQHKALVERGDTFLLKLTPIDRSTREMIVKEYFRQYNKELSKDQVAKILQHDSSANPLWLCIACDELRVYGHFRNLTAKITALADGLQGLLGQVLDRLRHEAGDDNALMVATLCLIEASRHGMKETELLQILADEKNLVPTGGNTAFIAATDKLPYLRWSRLTRSLKPFLRPYGDLGEGRLDFYHRALSKAVRQSYLAERNNVVWYHTKLASYFAQSTTSDGRRLEEYPYHLVQIGDRQRLKSFLCEWSTVDALYDPAHSRTLLYYWSQWDDFTLMRESLLTMLEELAEGDGTSRQQLLHRYVQVGRILLQASERESALETGERALALCSKKADGIDEKSKEDLGEEILQVYILLADVYESFALKGLYQDDSQFEPQHQCIKYRQCAIDVLQQQDGTQQETYLRLLVQQAYITGKYAALVRHKDRKQGAETKARAVATVDEAIDVLKQRQTSCSLRMLLAEAFYTKADLIKGLEPQEALELLSAAAGLCRSALGACHPLMVRILNTSAICHEIDDQFALAYEYFKRHYFLAAEVYGPRHPRADKARAMLQDLVGDELYKDVVSAESLRNDLAEAEGGGRETSP